MARIRTPEEQAALDAALVTSLVRAEEARARRRQAIGDFSRPQFARQAVNAALGVTTRAFANWQTRGQIELDADKDRNGRGRRLYSPRDVLRLGIALRLTEAGVAADHLSEILAAIDHRFELCVSNPMLAANVPVWFAILPGARVVGPVIGPAFEGEAVPADAFTALRLDLVIRSSLERLGLTVINGTAADHRAAIERMAPISDVDAA